MEKGTSYEHFCIILYCLDWSNRCYISCFCHYFRPFLSVGDVPPDYSPDPNSWVSSVRPATIDFNHLLEAPASLTINLPGDLGFSLNLSRFIHRAGFVFDDQGGTLDCSQQICEVIPDPAALPSDFSYRWFGSQNGYEVSLTVEKGVLRGLIEGNSRRWLITKNSNGGYDLSELDIYPGGSLRLSAENLVSP